MPQIEFDGQGVPIPVIALPPFGSDTDLPQTVLTFIDDATFSVFDYRNLGFTHFEVLCVGAAGGKGGDASSKLFSAIEEVRRPVPQDVWNLYIEYLRLQSYFATGLYDFPTIYSVPGYPPGQGFTNTQFEELLNPYHQLRFNTYRQILLAPSDEGVGGGGGGGGLHKVNGALVDLPDTVPIVVGKVGVDAPPGQTRQPGVWVPGMSDAPSPHGIVLSNVAQGTTDPAAVVRYRDLANFINAYTNSYPPPNNSFSPPVAGGDGGASSFAGAVSQASGGKGGAPGKVWDGTKFVVNGNGGNGGIGGQSAAGGGGFGSTTYGVNGADGIWHPPEGIGAGGGGGKGGANLPGTGFNASLATAGGQGSYSFADASVYGPRQSRQAWTYTAITEPSPALDISPTFPTLMNTYGGQYALSLYSGNIVFVPNISPPTTELLIPGGGGGARPATNLKVGSKAPGYSPNGAVVLRLVKLT